MSGAVLLLVFLLDYASVSAKTFASLVDDVVDGLGSLVVKLIFTLAVVYFMWGVTQYGFSPEEAQKEKGRQMMIWGILGLAVMFSVYALIEIVGNTFSLL
jgi:hypothetical protein